MADISKIKLGENTYNIKDASVPSWAKQNTKPTYTASEISDLANVATSGSYNDLSDKPTIPSTAGLATETYVDTAVSGLVNSAPQTLDTLNELADALGDDPNFATTVATQIGNKQDKPIDFGTWYTDTFGSGGLPTTDGTARTLSSSELSALNALTNDDSWEVSNIPAVLKINTQSLYTDWSWTYRGTNQNAKYCYIIKILPTRTGGKYWRRDTTIELAATNSLATVATSGSYNDLSNKPTIPAEVVVDSNITQNGTNPVQGSAIYAALQNKMEHILLIMKKTNGVLTFFDSSQNELTHSQVRQILNDSSKYVNIKYSGVVYEPFYLDFTEDQWMFKQNSMDNEYSISLSFDDEILLDEEYDSSLQSDYLDNYVPTSRKINNKALSSDITLTASDVGANTFIVNIIDGENEDEYACDKTNTEIYAAWQAGRSIIATYDIYIYPLVNGDITSTFAVFTGHQYDDPQCVDTWIIRVQNNSQVIHKAQTYLIDDEQPCASITNRNIGAWNNKLTRVIINMSYDESNDTLSFTDANNTALTHTQVINLLNDSTNDVLIYYKYVLHRTYGQADGYYFYSVIFEYGVYSYFSLYNNNGTLIVDEYTFFSVADANEVVYKGRKVNGKTLASDINTIVYGQKSSTGFRVGTYNSTTNTWRYDFSDTTLSVQTIYFDNTTGKAYTYNGKELKEFYSPNLSNFANINGDTGEDFSTRVLNVNDSNSVENVDFFAEYDTNSEIVSLRLSDSAEGESRVLPFNVTQNGTATIMTDSDFKTINNQSIIGSGNITINSGSPEAVVDVSANNANGNLIFTKANGNTITADLNHTHSQYLTAHQSLAGYAKYVLCQDETEYNNIQEKDSNTLYLIPES